MNSSEKQLKRKLIEKRKIVKQKLDLLKEGEVVHEDIFSPIIKHLKNIETKLTTATTTTRGKNEAGENTINISNGNPMSDLSEDEDKKNVSITTTPLPPKRRLQFHSTPIKTTKIECDNDESGNIKRSIIEEADRQEIENEPNLQADYERGRNQEIWNASFRD